MGAELALTFKQRIEEKHNEGVQLDQALREIVLKKLSAARECGILISEAQDQLRADEFRDLRDSLPFDSRALRAYLRFAAKNPDPVSDIAKALRSVELAAQPTGLLPFSNGHGMQTLHQPNFFSMATGIIMRLVVEWKKFTRERPVETWNADLAEQFLATLRPVIAIHKAVRQRLDKQPGGV